MKRTNVEAEKNELILQNESGDYAIIPANRRNEVLQLLEQGCYDCIDSIVASLPSAKDYAQDGTVIDNDPIYSGGTFNTVTTTAQAPNWLKYQREFNTKNPFNLEQEVQRRFDNPMGREAIDKIDEKGFKAKLEQEVLQRRTRQENKYIAQQLIKNIPQGKMSRAKWLDSLSDKEEEIVKSVFPKYQSSLWTDTKRGLQSLVETNPIQAFTNIAKSKDYSTREKRELLKEYIDHPMMSKVSDAAKILSPLTVGSKIIQSAYKDETTLSDALKGKKNKAGALEDIITDPTTYTGLGIAKSMIKAGLKPPIASSVDDVIDLYRIQERNAKTFQQLADEGKLNKAFNNPQTLARKAEEEKYFGQWFTNDKKDLDFYKADREFRDPEIIHLRVPKSELPKYSNYDKALSRAPDREFVIPLSEQQKYMNTSVDDVVNYYHGSPWRWDNYDPSTIGKAEGASKYMQGLNLFPENRLHVAPKFANIKSKDAPIHLGKGRPLTPEEIQNINPSVYTFQDVGNKLNLKKLNPIDVKKFKQEDLVKEGFDGIDVGGQITVFPNSVSKLKKSKVESIEEFIKSKPDVKEWTPWSTKSASSVDDVGRESLLDIGVQSLSDKYSIPDKDKLIQALKDTDNILSQFVGELMQGGANRQAIKKGNEWLENWIKNPATQKKIEDDIREALSYPIGYTAETTLNLVKEQAKSFKPNSKEFSLMKQLEDNIKQYISKDKTRQPIHSNNYGVNYTHYKDARYRNAVEEGLEIPDDVYGSWISRSSNIPQSKRELTTIHEGTHDWASNEVLRLTEQHNYISSRLNKDIFNKDKTTNLTSKQIDYLKYLAKPTEVHARIMELRRYFNLSPETKLTPQQTLDMVRTLQKLPKNEQPINVKGFLYVLDQGDLKQNVLNLTSLFNRLWAVPAAVIGTQAVQAQSDDNEIKAEDGLVVSNTNPPKEAIDNLLKKYNSPMTADDFLYVSNQTGIGVDALLGQALLESSFGTKGKGARANNPLNWGNDDEGNIRTYGSYREGLLTAAQGLKEKFYFTTPEDFIERGFKGKYGIYATDPDYKTKYTNYINQVRRDLGMSGLQIVVPTTQPVQQQVAVPTMPDISSLFQLPNENVRIINAPSISGNIPSVQTGSTITTEDKLNIPKEELLALKQRFTMQGYTPSNSYFDKDILKMAFLDNAGKLGKYDQFPLDDVSLQKLANTLKSIDNAM